MLKMQIPPEFSPENADFLFQNGMKTEVMINDVLIHVHQDYGIKKFNHQSLKLNENLVTKIEKLCLKVLDHFQDQAEGYLWIADFCVVHFYMKQGFDHIQRQNHIIFGQILSNELVDLPINIDGFDRKIDQIFMKYSPHFNFELYQGDDMKYKKTNSRSKPIVLVGFIICIGIAFFVYTQYWMKQNHLQQKNKEMMETIAHQSDQGYQKIWKAPHLQLTQDQIMKYKNIYSKAEYQRLSNSLNLLSTFVNMQHHKQADYLMKQFCESKSEQINENDFKYALNALDVVGLKLIKSDIDLLRNSIDCSK
jgi:hypothetical protein